MSLDHLTGSESPSRHGARRALDEAEARHQLAEEAMQAAAVLYADALIDHPHDRSLASWHRLQYTHARASLRAAIDDVEDAHEALCGTQLRPTITVQNVGTHRAAG